ncbi:MAG TPA: outer-membrane lipoprotein carrier protein LolA [Chthoniobacterales bacterium]|nr:outer-membrane lipoprotein carrier protein LolA [Chthoniobacterales bacterium]
MRYPFLFGLMLTASLAHAQSLSPADIKSLLARIREHRASTPDVHASFQEQKTIHLMNKPLVSSGKIWFHAPNKFRREVTGNSPSMTVSNGRDLWIYYPNFKSAEHYTLGKHSPVDAVIAAINTALNLENVENTFHITGAKTGNGYDLRLLPRSPSTKRMFQQFDLRLNSDFAAEKTDMIQPGGDQIVTVYSNQTHAAIPESTFEFTPPAGTEVATPLGR